MSQVVDAARRFKADLARREVSAVRLMATQYAGVVRSLERSIDEVAAAMAAQKAAGKAVTLTGLYRDERYRTLLAQAQGEFARYENTTANLITSERAAFARLGASQAVDLLDIMQPGLSTQFNRLPTIAIQNMAGFLIDSAPLHKLLKDAWPHAIRATTSALVEGVALGYNPRKIARMMRDGIGGGLKRSLVIARTETLRAYRTASLDTYRGYGPDVVRGYQRLATHSVRTCPACLFADGEFYKLEAEFAEHPVGRCTIVPCLKDAPLHTWKQGPEWFEGQPADRQLAILGKGKYEAWKAGDLDLRAIPERVSNATWGPSMRVRSLAELTGGVGPRGVRFAVSTPPPPSAFKTGTQDLMPFNVAREQTADHIELTRRAEVWANTLSDEQKQSVTKWTRHWQITRQNIANGNIGPEEKMLLDAVKSAPKIEGIVYRGINPGGIGQSADDVREVFRSGIGTTIEWDTLSSTSILPDLAAEFGNTVFEIKTKNARYINPLSQFFGKAEDEFEAVILPNTKFKIVGVGRAPIEFLAAQQERWIVQLEEIIP